MKRWATLLLLSLLGGFGCGDRMDLHPVTGTVKFADGSVPQGEMATVTFQPVNAMDGKAATGSLEEDGSFELWTLEQGDGGALAGEYFVTLNIIKGYPNRVHMVHPKYADASETPLKATVEKGKDNHFDFEVEKPKKRR